MHVKTVLCMTMLLIPAMAYADDPSHPDCISNIRVNHTTVVDDRHIIFVMNDHSAYRTTLPQDCPGLKDDTRGFTYSPSDNNDQLCANVMTIRLNTLHLVCMLGPWERVK